MKGSPNKLLILNLASKHQFWINKRELEGKFTDLEPGFIKSQGTNWYVKQDGIIIRFKLTIWNENESFEETYKGKLFINNTLMIF